MPTYQVTMRPIEGCRPGSLHVNADEFEVNDVGALVFYRRLTRPEGGTEAFPGQHHGAPLTRIRAYSAHQWDEVGVVEPAP